MHAANVQCIAAGLVNDDVNISVTVVVLVVGKELFDSGPQVVRISFASCLNEGALRLENTCHEPLIFAAGTVGFASRLAGLESERDAPRAYRRPSHHVHVPASVRPSQRAGAT